MKRENTTILIADDSEEDRILLLRAIRKCEIPGVSTRMLSSGYDAIRYLSGIKPYEDRKQFPYPTFLLTDLKMPDGDGFDILAYLKNTPRSAIIPTVVLSSSADSDDIKRAYSLGASAYLVKPVDNLALTGMIKNLMAFWLICEVPEVDEGGVQILTEGARKIGERFQKDVTRKPMLATSTD